MIHGLVIIFLLLSALFALTHQLAVAASLYWYYWWFDILMHFWGGSLLTLGVYSLGTLSRLHFKPTVGIILFVLLLATVSWEVFERFAGLYDPQTYLVDTIQDVLIGFSGGLLAHLVLRRYTIR
jgi:hypothetical protein